MPSNRDLLLQRRKKERGLAVTAIPADAPAKDTSRRTGRDKPVTTGFQGISRRAGEAELAKFPGVAENIIEPGKALAGEFAGLRPQPKTTALAQGGQVAADATDASLGGIPKNVTIKERAAKGLAPTTPSQSFGLPTDRLPSFNELGGAIGQLFKHVGGIARKRRALGLIPGRVTAAKDLAQGLKGKDLANILIKQLEAANLSGDKEKAAEINARLENIVNPQKAEEASDLEAILSE
jgi:hypothetical protein